MLENTVYRLKHDKKLSIGFIGGSITEGCGASSPKTSWVGRTYDWFTRTYPEAEFRFENAAIGGTGSMLGVYRLEHELLDKSDPDLVFVEFAVNDWSWPYDGIFSDMEAIVRKIRTRKPTADIIFIYTATLYATQSLVAGCEMESRSAHSAVAHYYGNILCVEIGEALRDAVYLHAGGDWLKYTQDNVHPNDEGYRIYADALIAQLEKYLGGAEVPAELVSYGNMPPRLSKFDRTEARMIDPSEAVMSDGWTIINEPICGKGTHYIRADKPGAWIELHFTGRRAGIYQAMTNDSGYFAYSIDGGPEKKDCSYTSAGQIAMCMTNEMEYGEHVYKLRILEDKPEGSSGTSLNFISFIVS